MFTLHDDRKIKFFRCRECRGNFPESKKILYGKNGIEICEYCWEEINENLRKIRSKQLKKEKCNSHETSGRCCKNNHWNFQKSHKRNDITFPNVIHKYCKNCWDWFCFVRISQPFKTCIPQRRLGCNSNNSNHARFYKNKQNRVMVENFNKKNLIWKKENS